MEAGTIGPGSDELLAEAGVEVPAAAAAPVVAPVSTPAKPDITKAQIIGSVPVIGKLLVAIGIAHLTKTQEAALGEALYGTYVLIGGDAVIRLGRSIGFGRK